MTGCSASPWTPEDPDLESLPLAEKALPEAMQKFHPRRALPPRAPLRLNFTAQQHYFYPNIEQTPDGFTHLGFVGLLRKLAASEPRRALPPRAPLRLNFTAQQHYFYPNIEQTPDGKPPGVCRLAAQARCIRTEAGLAPSGSPAAQFHSAAASFYPNIEQAPDGFTHLGFVGLLRKLAASEPRRALPPRALPLLRHTTQPHHFTTTQNKPQMVLPIWGSFNREENMRREKLAN